MRLVSEYSVSIVRRCVAKRSLAPSSAVAAESSPASRKRVAVGVVCYTRSIPLTTIASVLSIADICYLM
jgi:hypothetical protein